jgi:hypothetical protein
VVGISSILKLENLRHEVPLVNRLVHHWPVLTTMWDAMVGPLALTVLMGFIPTFISMITASFCYMKSSSSLQQKIQLWYFYFLFIFVLLVTAIGSSLVATAQEIWRNPSSIFTQLAVALPQSTHFYLKFMPAQWASIALVMTRWVCVLKYCALRKLFGESHAKEMAEPEDQDWYGIGGRSARLALYLNVVVVLSTLSPLITVFGYLTFVLCRMVYTYLFLYAETKKPVLGGLFWYSQLKHTQQGLFIYIALMSGVLFQRADSVWPGCIALSSFIFLVISYNRFDRAFQWEFLPLHQLTAGDEKVNVVGAYEQPEMTPMSALAVSS